MSEIVQRIRLLEGWSRVDRVLVRHADGTEWDRTLEDHGLAAAVLPYDPVRRTCLLVSMPRPAVLAFGSGDDLLEAPSGMLDDGETFEEAARREALEEAGLQFGDLEPVVTLWTMPGLSTERVGIFLAAYEPGARVSAGGGAPDENEQIAITEIYFADLKRMVMTGRLEDGKTLVAAQALMLRHPYLF